MIFQIVGCSHHNASVELRERLAFSPEQTKRALGLLRQRFPGAESVLLSTCNRVELYAGAANAARSPDPDQLVSFLADFHDLRPVEILDSLFKLTGEEAVGHLFTVAASLDSMVVGEAQILSQVKTAYDMATAEDNTGPITHAAFQAAIRVAKRVASDTAIQQKRVSIPSVAVADFAKGIFERFDDKQVLVIGAGDMGEETLRYLIDEGARNITIINRNRQRAEHLAGQIQLPSLDSPRVDDWQNLMALLVDADVVVSATGASEPIVTLDDFQRIASNRHQRSLFILDLAIPRDFQPAIANAIGVYLYCVDDLKAACDANRRAREKEWPLAQRIIRDETKKFLADLRHRSTGPAIRQLKQRAQEIKADELQRLLNKLGEVSPTQTKEIERSFDRLVNKLLHPPLESLRESLQDDTQRSPHHGLLDALIRLFQLKD